MSTITGLLRKCKGTSVHESPNRSQLSGYLLANDGIRDCCSKASTPKIMHRSVQIAMSAIYPCSVCSGEVALTDTLLVPHLLIVLHQRRIHQHGLIDPPFASCFNKCTPLASWICPKTCSIGLNASRDSTGAVNRLVSSSHPTGVPSCIASSAPSLCGGVWVINTSMSEGMAAWISRASAPRR